jgi:pyrrolidone-carboxylate peptidase
VPLLPEQAACTSGQPSLALSLQIEGVRLALQAALAYTQDLRVAGGSVS